MKQLIVLFCACLLGNGAMAQRLNIDFFLTMEPALRDPQAVKYLEIDDYGDDIALLIENLPKFRSLHSICLSGEIPTEELSVILEQLQKHPIDFKLILKNNGLQTVPEALGKLPNMQQFRIKGNEDLDYRELMDLLKGNPQLQELELAENQLQTLPKNIQELENLNKLVIEGNENLDFERSVKSISELPKLRHLSLPINQLTGLPDNINTLKNLESLDLQNNILTDVSPQLVKLKALDTLRVEGNIIVDPAEAFEQVKGLDIKFLSLDDGLSEEDRLRLEELFPHAKVVEYSQARGGMTARSEPRTKPVVKDVPAGVGEMKLASGQLRVLSGAYLHYPKIFNSELFRYEFDTLLFEDRYLNTEYVNTWKRQPNTDYKYIALDGFRRGNKGEIWFDFSRKRFSNLNTYLSRNNPEVNAFKGMKWVYTGELDRKSFRKRYLRNKFWTDVRIIYREEDKNFVIELKHAEGFDRIGAFPRYQDPGLVLEKSQKTYQKRYERYTRALLRRKHHFQSELRRSKMHYDKLHQEKIASEWQNLRECCFSPEELQMTKAQWLEYYDRVIAQEKRALNNTDASLEHLERSLEVQGYRMIDSEKLHSEGKEIPAEFRYRDSSRVADQNILLIDPLEKEVHRYHGGLGLEKVPVNINPAGGQVLVVIARNGEIGVLSAGEFSALSCGDGAFYTFYLKRFKTGLYTVGEILRSGGL